MVEIPFIFPLKTYLFVSRPFYVKYWSNLLIVYIIYKTVNLQWQLHLHVIYSKERLLFFIFIWPFAIALTFSFNLLYFKRKAFNSSITTFYHSKNHIYKKQVMLFVETKIHSGMLQKSKIWSLHLNVHVYPYPHQIGTWYVLAVSYTTQHIHTSWHHLPYQ